ncbi:hypothetical protein [Luteimonas mephitis]|uniref:hypothetical protein n=1 Tax=Luteimonas mephitis TaxID=83615 RepID=UPI001B7F7FE6|nr:hypothetical protein [Luteimonas mephitis]
MDFWDMVSPSMVRHGERGRWQAVRGNGPEGRVVAARIPSGWRQTRAMTPRNGAAAFGWTGVRVSYANTNEQDVICAEFLQTRRQIRRKASN